MEIEFEFRKEESKILGQVMRPVARIIFVGENIEVPELAYVDSGADLTLIPRSVGDLLGLQITNADEVKEIKGIGERTVPILIKKLKIKIGDKVISARIAWSLIEDVPILLGRLDIFNLFNINFKKEKAVSFNDS